MLLQETVIPESVTSEPSSSDQRVRLWLRHAWRAVILDHNATYGTALRYPVIDRIMRRVVFWHLPLLLGLVVLAGAVRLPDNIPTPLLWRSLPSDVSLVLVLLGSLVAAVPFVTRTRITDHSHVRIMMAMCLAVYSCLLLLVSGGSIEWFGHFFLTMALLTMYGDWRLGWVVTGIGIAYHLVASLIDPQWAFWYGALPLAIPLHIALLTAMAILTSLMAQYHRDTVVSLVDAQRLNNDFLAIASHELRTPLTSMQGYADLLERRTRRQPDERLHQYSSKLQEQLHRLTGLVRDLLDVSRIQSGGVRIAPELVSLNTVVLQAVEDVQALATRHAIDVEGTARGAVWGDPVRLGQVLVNLLTNALKYSPDGGRIIVRLRQTPDRAIVSVQDFGIGISVADRQRMFDPYFRSQAVQREDVPGGLGIGLYVARTIVDRHRGRIWVESVVGEGSTFAVSLPLVKAGEGRR